MRGRGPALNGSHGVSPTTPLITGFGGVTVKNYGSAPIKRAAWKFNFPATAFRRQGVEARSPNYQSNERCSGSMEIYAWGRCVATPLDYLFCVPWRITKVKIKIRKLWKRINKYIISLRTNLTEIIL